MGSRLLKEMERRTLMGERKKRSNLLEDVNSCEENDYEIQRLSPSSRLKKMGFPQKLWLLLQETRHDIISWIAPDNIAFKILDADAFQCCVIPKYFKHKKLSSFQRQLNLYGFRRITKGKDTGAYFHPNFRGDSHFKDLSNQV